MFSKKYLTISDFAKIAGVSRQTLIYYDRIGLFSPTHTAGNKYRMYSHKQVDNIGIITILSDLGVPLKKIKEILADISIDTMEKTLHYQLTAIEGKIETLSRLKEMTEIRLEQMREGRAYRQNADPVFSVQTIAEEIPIFVGEKIDRPQEAIDDDTVIAFFDDIEKHGLPSIFTFGYVKSAEELLLRGESEVLHMWFRLKNQKPANASIARGKYLIGYAKGDYGTTDFVYGELLQYAKTHKLTLVGNVYEEYLIDELSEKNPNDYVLKIFVRVEA